MALGHFDYDRQAAPQTSAENRRDIISGTREREYSYCAMRGGQPCDARAEAKVRTQIRLPYVRLTGASQRVRRPRRARSRPPVHLPSLKGKRIHLMTIFSLHAVLDIGSSPVGVA